ncbi:MAG TPA: hypothetical protein VJ597_03820 [Sphingomicrobium sp.]|nr:hypothetical protein [Sphingomicrobium sp.]
MNHTDSAPAGDAASLESEICEAHASLQSCFREMEEVLARPEFDATALTSVRLKLAGLRLTRGPLITKVAMALVGKVTEQEAAVLEELRTSHQELLQTATAHTSKWTIDAIAQNWPQYRQETRALIQQWVIKAEREQHLVCPLVRRCA